MKRPFITIILIIANLAVLGLMLSNSGDAGLFSSGNPIIRAGIKQNDLIRQGELYRLLACTFIHLSWIHILMNMYVLYELGTLAETVWNRLSFLIIYFISGLGGSLASFAFVPNPSAGASGAVFGLAGALLTARYLASEEQVPMQGRAFGSIGIFVVYNLVYGLRSRGIDNAGHIGGLLAGALVGYALLRRQNFITRILALALTVAALWFLYQKGMGHSPF